MPNLHFVWAAERLNQSKAIAEIADHLNWIYVNVRLMAESKQLPNRHTKGPLHSNENKLLQNTLM